MEGDEVYGKFVLTVCISSILYFCKNFADCNKTDCASLFTRGIIRNIILNYFTEYFRKLKMERTNYFHEYL